MRTPVHRLPTAVAASHFPMLAAMTSICLSTVTFAQPELPPPHLDPVNRSLWSSNELGIRFTYPVAWELGTPTQDSTRVVVTWRLKKSKALLATCYVEAHGSTESQVAALRATDIHNAAKSVAQSALQNMRQRAPDAELLTWKRTVQDGQPAVYMIRQGTVETFDKSHRTKLYSLVTAWRNREINFECGTTVFGSEYTKLEGGPRLIEQVELSILNVMRTLQFDRAASR